MASARAKAMGKSCALMMRGHGANVTGKTVQEACSKHGSLRADGEDDAYGRESIGRFSPISPAVANKFRAVASRQG